MPITSDLENENVLETLIKETCDETVVNVFSLQSVANNISHLVIDPSSSTNTQKAVFNSQNGMLNLSKKTLSKSQSSILEKGLNQCRLSRG